MTKAKKATASTADWIFFAKSYLALAYTGIQELRERKYCKEPNYLWRAQQVYNSKMLLVPIIWNIKHAIELILKAHNQSFQGNYRKSHNLNDLKDDLAKGLDITDVERDERLDELAHIADKYYKLEVFNRKLTIDKVIFDSENDLLRYPEGSKAKTSVDANLLLKITDQDLKELENDIEILNRRILFPFGYKYLKPVWTELSKR